MTRHQAPMPGGDSALSAVRRARELSEADHEQVDLSLIHI